MIKMKKWTMEISNFNSVTLRGIVANDYRFNDNQMIYTTKINDILIHEDYLIAKTENTEYKLNYLDALILQSDFKFIINNKLVESNHIFSIAYMKIINNIADISDRINEIIIMSKVKSYNIDLSIEKLVMECKTNFIKSIEKEYDYIEEDKLIKINHLLVKTINSYINNLITVCNLAKLDNNELLIIMSTQAHYNYIESFAYYNEKLFSPRMMTHLGSFTDSVLIYNQFSSECELKYFPEREKISVYSISHNIKRVVIYNEGIESFIITGIGEERLCSGKEFTSIEVKRN